MESIASGCGCERCQIGPKGPAKNKIDFVLIKIGIGALAFIAGLILRKTGCSLFVFLGAYLILGHSVIIQAAKNIVKGKIFDENFLMLIASAGAFAIGEYPEAAGVMLFYGIGEYLQDRAVDRSKKSIQSLLKIKPDSANLETEKGMIQVDPDTVSVGEIIVVKPGERVPLDGTVVDGSSAVDVSALTGEFLPADAGPGDTVLSGSINVTGVIRIRVSTPFAESTASRILKLISEASEKKAPAEQFITRFARYYTPAVVGLAALVSLVPSLIIHGTLTAEWLYRGLITLVVSCPCALLLSIPLAYFGGIGAASRKGILIKGGNYLEALVRADSVIFDKTGTLTTGSFSVADIVPMNGLSREELLYYAAHGEYYSRHPIAEALRNEYGKPFKSESIGSYTEISGFGVRAMVDNREIVIGNSRTLMHWEGTASETKNPGTTAYITVDGLNRGYITLKDTIKKSSFELTESLKRAGIRRVVMLTGDTEASARETAEALGIDRYHARLLPEEKLNAARKYMGGGSTAIAVGDGINDAPLLANADIGIAMGAIGSDAAVESADIVLMKDDPLQVAESIRIARKTRRIVWQNISFALGVKGLVLVLGTLGLASMYQAIFADVGVALLAILNSVRIIKK